MNIIDPKLQFRALNYNNFPTNIVLHHAQASKCTIQDIHNWHLSNGGWAGCGYHYLVRKDGSIFRGRPENAQGSHCPGYNTNSIGICAEGDYMKEQMPLVQKNAIIELIRDIKGRYPIQTTIGHREVYATSCPGTNYPLDELKAVSIMKDYKAILNGKGLSNPGEWIKLVEELEKGNIPLDKVGILKFLKVLIEKLGN